MKALKVVGGVAVLAAFGYGVFAWKTGQFAEVPFVGEPKARVVEEKVAQGTELKLLLLESLDAGGSKVGDEVELAVAEDLKGKSGEVVVPRGARVMGEVVQSRGASLASAVANRPARLAISLDKLMLADGKTISLRAPDGKEQYEFTQENTAERVDSVKIEKLWESEKSREALAGLADKVMQGEELDPNDADLEVVAKELGMKRTQELKDKGEGVNKLTLGKALDAFTSGNIGTLVGADAVLAAQAMGEVTDLVSSVDHKVRGVFKARTIRANVGTPVTAEVAEAFAIKVTIQPSVLKK